MTTSNASSTGLYQHGQRIQRQKSLSCSVSHLSPWMPCFIVLHHWVLPHSQRHTSHISTLSGPLKYVREHHSSTVPCLPFCNAYFCFKGWYLRDEVSQWFRGPPHDHKFDNLTTISVVEVLERSQSEFFQIPDWLGHLRLHSPPALTTLLLTMGDFAPAWPQKLQQRQWMQDRFEQLPKHDWQAMLKGLGQGNCVPSLTSIRLGLRASGCSFNQFVKHGINAHQSGSEWMEWTDNLRGAIDEQLTNHHGVSADIVWPMY